MPDAPPDHRRATAQRNVEAILDAAERLLARGAPATTSAVAAEAGVSRVTVYAHFATREALLEAVVERVVRHATAAIDAARVDEGEPAAALDRLVAAGWREIDRNRAVANAAAEQLSPVAMTRSHAALHEPIAALVRRGQQSGDFRDDLPPGWLVTSYFTLMHACGEEVRAGRLPADDAVDVLQATLRGAFSRS
jgi:TetR/AcrR family transcriptional repressor of mexCD-oprJ operon